MLDALMNTLESVLLAVSPDRFQKWDQGPSEGAFVRGSGFFPRLWVCEGALHVGLPVQPRGRLTEKSRRTTC